MAGVGPTLRFDDVERSVAECPEIVRAAPERVFWSLPRVPDVLCEIMQGLLKLRCAGSPVKVLYHGLQPEQEIIPGGVSRLQPG